jgi:opacity protein-like surface antigen
MSRKSSTALFLGLVLFFASALSGRGDCRPTAGLFITTANTMANPTYTAGQYTLTSSAAKIEVKKGGSVIYTHNIQTGYISRYLFYGTNSDFLLINDTKGNTVDVTIELLLVNLAKTPAPAEYFILSKNYFVSQLPQLHIQPSAGNGEAVFVFIGRDSGQLSQVEELQIRCSNNGIVMCSCLSFHPVGQVIAEATATTVRIKEGGTIKAECPFPSPKIEISPSSLDFLSVVEGHSKVLPLTIRNTGNLDLTYSISSANAMFTASPNGGTIAAAGTATVQVTFAPPTGAAPGPQSGLLSIVHNDASQTSPKQVNLTGTIMAAVPRACYSTSTLAFGNVNTGHSSTKDFTINNCGEASLQVSNIVLTTPDPSGVWSISPSVPPMITIAASTSRTFSVKLTVPAGLTSDVDYTANIDVTTNDSANAVQRITASGRGHVPVPKLNLLTSSIDYREVEISYRYRQAVRVKNDGDAALTFSISVTDLPDPDESEYAPSVGDFSVPPFQEIFLEMTFAPTRLGPSEIKLLVDNSNDPTWVPTIVNLFGTGVGALPLSSMMVLDRSGSMSANCGDVPKIEASRDAGILYTELLNDQYDYLGLTRFNQDSQTIVNLDRIANNRSAAQSKLNDIGGELFPSGSTAIGKGMVEGSGQFASSPLENAQTMIVLTDGKENVPPNILDVKVGIQTAYPNLRIFCVGIGDPIETGPYGLEGIETEKLEQIADETKALFKVIRSISGENRYALESFYFKVFNKSKGRQVVLDPLYHLAFSGQTQEIASVNIAECDREADFLIISELLRAYPNERLIKLQDPSGQVIDPSSTIGGVGVHVKNWGNAQFIRIKFPPRSQSDSYTGTWRLLLQPTSSKRLTAAVAVAPKTASVAFMASVGSDYRMKASLTGGPVYIGQPVHLAAELTEAWWPAPNGAVNAEITRPDGSKVTRSLFDDGLHGDGMAGDGTFGLEMTDTWQKGYYEFFFRGNGYTERGEVVTREERLAKFVRGVATEKPPHLRRLYNSFHVGATYPLGSLDTQSDSNIHIRADSAFLINDRVHFVAMVGLNQFSAEYASADSHPRWFNISANVKALSSPVGGKRFYLQGGFGYYLPKTGSNSLGLNAGAGIQYVVTDSFSLEWGFDYHRLLTDKTVSFLTFQLGVLFR